VGKLSALEELAGNARRLLADAELVFERGSHQTATSLAILALEEAGKYFQMKWAADEKAPARRTPERGPKAHRSKQATIASFHAADAAINAIKEILRGLGLPEDEASIQKFVTIIRNRDDEIGRDSSAALTAFVAGKMATDEKAKLMRFAHRGLIDRIKQQGLYVDIDKEGKVTSSPNSLTAADAEEWMGHARDAIAMLPE
jgi:AbiV family abortive infection protein